MPRSGNTEELFWAKVNKDGPTQPHMDTNCWVWTAYVKNTGYGELGVKRKTTTAHRYSYTLAHGAIPAGLVVCHRCDNRICVRPDHLFLGTHQDNHRDMMVKGRHGRRLTDDQVRDIRHRHGHERVNCGSLSTEYGVSLQMIFRIVTLKAYRHVTPKGRSKKPQPSTNRVKRRYLNR